MRITNMPSPVVGDILGTGEYGLVILLEMADHTKVAVKRSYCGNRHLQHEYAILSLIRKKSPHGVPGIPQLYSSWRYEGLAMEYIEGQVIADALLATGEAGQQEAVLAYITELLCIFAKLHAMHIVHRDVHERNILLDLDGHVHVVDFGLAQYRPDPKRYRTEVCDLWTLTQAWIEIYMGAWPLQCLVLEYYTAWFERLPPQQPVCAADLLAAWQAIRWHIA